MFRQVHSKLASEKRSPASSRDSFRFATNRELGLDPKTAFCVNSNHSPEHSLRSKLFFRKEKTVLDNRSSSVCRKNSPSAPLNHRFGSLPHPASFLVHFAGQTQTKTDQNTNINAYSLPLSLNLPELSLREGKRGFEMALRRHPDPESTLRARLLEKQFKSDGSGPES